jgi:2,3-bisphosphoglycerate-dependent phosphoglycerate mutase
MLRTLPRTPPPHDGTPDVGPGRVLWLVRHGETTWNARGIAQGHCDLARLTPRGVRQAWRVVGQLCDRPICALYASDLHRAMETAAPLAAVLGLPVIRDARLRERSLGAAEGTGAAAIGPVLSGLRAQAVIDPDAAPPGGESLRNLCERVAAFADDLAASRLPGLAGTGPHGTGPHGTGPHGDGPHGDVAVVAHGGTLRVLTAYLSGVPVEQMRWEPLANGTILRSATGRPGTRRPDTGR